LKASGYRTGFIGKFGIASDGIEPTLEDKVGIEKMFHHFDNFEHWTDYGYEMPQQNGIRHLTDITGDKAVEFLESHYNNQPDQPFCLSVSFNAPHAQDGDPRHYIWPESEEGLYENDIVPDAVNSEAAFFEALPQFIRESESRVRWYTRFDTPENYQRNVKGLYRMVSGVDRNVGRIVTALQRLYFRDNTVILFSSDHGMYYGERGLSDCWQLNEESIRIPFIIFDPRIQAGNPIVIEEMVLNIDLAPTILELAGLPIPAIVQGQSLLSLIDGSADDWRNEFFCEHLFDRHDIPKSEGLRTKRWKYIRYFEQNPVHEELYDLESDPHESQNLAHDANTANLLTDMRFRCTESSRRAASG
jgi:arylsulfatase A-like enzyme